MAMAGFKTVAFRHFDGLFVGKGHTQPGITGFRDERRIALHLEFEKPSGPEDPAYLAYVVVNHFPAGDVLKDNGGKGEIDFDIA